MGQGCKGEGRALVVQVMAAIEALDPHGLCADYWAGKAEREAAAAGLPPPERRGGGNAGAAGARAPPAGGGGRRRGGKRGRCVCSRTPCGAGKAKMGCWSRGHQY